MLHSISNIINNLSQLQRVFIRNKLRQGPLTSSEEAGHRALQAPTGRARCGPVALQGRTTKADAKGRRSYSGKFSLTIFTNMLSAQYCHVGYCCVTLNTVVSQLTVSVDAQAISNCNCCNVENQNQTKLDSSVVPKRCKLFIVFYRIT